jgi:hypothetical protein
MMIFCYVMCVLVVLFGNKLNSSGGRCCSFDRFTLCFVTADGGAVGRDGGCVVGWCAGRINNK